MDGYLLDTNAISALLDPLHPNHQNMQDAADGIEAGAPRYASCIALAEVMFGARLDEAVTGYIHPRTKTIIAEAQKYAIREITRHTAPEWAELRKSLATTYLETYIRSHRPRWVNNWIDRATGERLQIDENDLWICAQARESNLILMTTDKDMVTRIAKADSTIRFHLVRSV